MFLCWRRSSRGPDGQLSHDLDQGNWRLLSHRPCPWNVSYSCLLHPPRGCHSVVTQCGNYLDGIRDSIHLRPLCKLLRFGRQVWKTAVLLPSKTSLSRRLSFSLKLPPASLEWFVSFCGLSLPFVWAWKWMLEVERHLVWFP